MYKARAWQRKYVSTSKLHIYMHEDGRVLKETERKDYFWGNLGFRFVISLTKYEWRDI